MSRPSTSRTRTRSRTGAAVAGTALTGALLLAACGSDGSSSSGGLYGNAPAGSGTSPSSASASSSSAGGGRYGNPPAGSSSAGTASGPPTTARSRIGTILVTAQRMTMYVFALDPRGQSRCTGSCATYWPPVPASDAPKHAVAGVTATFGSVTRADGSTQLSVDGYPVYTYAGDRSPGDVNGQGVNASGGLWWALSPDGSRDTRS
jgi:predicted lipoprotein with Yx(FWY)xxD motif